MDDRCARMFGFGIGVSLMGGGRTGTSKAGRCCVLTWANDGVMRRQVWPYRFWYGSRCYWEVVCYGMRGVFVGMCVGYFGGGIISGD